MIKKIVSSDDGFGIIQALVGLIIVTIALSGLFLSSYYAWHSALGNYHYRVALLKAHQKLEEVKFLNRNNESVTLTNTITSGDFIMDEEDGELVWARIHPPQRDTFIDRAVSEYVNFDRIQIKITWRDGPERFLNNILNKERALVLREDYYYRINMEGE